MRRSVWLMVLSVFGFGAAVGCAVIPKHIEKDALPEMPLPVLIKQAGQYVGKTVILGGYVLEVRNIKNKTRIVAIQAPLDEDYKPKQKKLSQGIIILNHNGFLDPQVYVKDSGITVAGELLGSSATKTIQMPYPFVEIELIHIHLWPE